MQRLVTTVLSLCLMVPLSVQAEEAEHMLDASTLDNVRKVAPALEKYTQGPLADLWQRPGLSPRDRSIVTRRGAGCAQPHGTRRRHDLNVALDNGVKPAEISELITHSAFYSGRGNAISAVARDQGCVREARPVRSEQLAQVSPHVTSPRMRNGRRIAPSASGGAVRSTCPLESCSTRPRSFSWIFGCARTWPREIAAWSPSAR